MAGMTGQEQMPQQPKTAVDRVCSICHDIIPSLEPYSYLTASGGVGGSPEICCSKCASVLSQPPKALHGERCASCYKFLTPENPVSIRMDDDDSSRAYCQRCSDRVKESRIPSEKDGPPLPGGSTPKQYGLPEGATELQDLIEYRKMNFAVGNIFKACYRQGNCSHSDALRDARKIAWFAQREVDRLEKCRD